MRILEHHQNRSVSRQGFELVQLRFEQHLALALRAKVQVGSWARQRQQLGQQHDLALATRE